MGKSDGGFEYDLRDKLNKFREENKEAAEMGLWAKRIPQSRYNKQFVDVILSSKSSDYHMAFECKSKKIKGKTDKIHFSSHFRDDQVETICNYREKSKRETYLALAFRRGRGRKTWHYLVNWDKFMEWWNDEDCNGITPEMANNNGYDITDGINKFLDEKNN